MRYAVVFEKSSTGYSAYLPDLPGCVASGKTLKKVKRLIREAAKMHLQAMRKDLAPIPGPSTLTDYITVA